MSPFSPSVLYIEFNPIMPAYDASRLILPLFTLPRPAPTPPPSSISSGSLQGFVIPSIPPPNCPLSITIEKAGHRRLPVISNNPLPLDHERVRKLIRHRADISAKRAFPAPRALSSASPIAHSPILMLIRERDVLCAAICDNHLAPSQFEREYKHTSAWFYSATQGAISCFLINSHSTAELASRGYQALVASSTDPSFLSRFLAFGSEAHIHPSVLCLAAKRLHALYLSFLG
ncbi:hypothetical protein B0H17DRAFT_1143357 [Mycena rosella]|uniref:Uncharacterized protein n=1 Tax=Mycena rosella TaxID=1033263 RepID=A0AAD7CVR1_MYCRO|nr:hypothetical protein B0H17DRAFT_1143357 [Mycena rosella]